MHIPVDIIDMCRSNHLSIFDRVDARLSTWHPDELRLSYLASYVCITVDCDGQVIVHTVDFGNFSPGMFYRTVICTAMYNTPMKVNFNAPTHERAYVVYGILCLPIYPTFCSVFIFYEDALTVLMIQQRENFAR
eukprot:1183118-Prorocentrum_minimum.AAC.5